MTKRIMRVLMIILMLGVITGLGNHTAEAWETEPHNIGNSVRYKYLISYQPYQVDLNGDGKKELVKSDRGDLLVNGRVLLHKEDSLMDVMLYDYNKNDKFKEILIISSVYGKKHGNYTKITGRLIELYRYDKGRFKRYAYGKANGVKRQKITKAGVIPWYGEYSTLLDGAVTWMNKRLVLRGAVVDSGYGSTWEFNLVYKVKKGKFALDTSKTFKAPKNDPTVASAPANLFVYKKKSLSSNKLLFKVKWGKIIKLLKMKVSKKTTAIQIQYKGKKGWIFVKTSGLKG